MFNFCRLTCSFEMLCLPPHTTHVLQTSTELSSSPSRQALIKRQHNSGTILTLQSRNLVSDNVSSLLGRKGPTVGNAVKALECTVIYLLTLTISPKIHFGPLHALHKIQSTPCQQALIRFHSKATNLQDHQISSRHQS